MSSATLLLPGEGSFIGDSFPVQKIILCIVDSQRSVASLSGLQGPELNLQLYYQRCEAVLRHYAALS